MTTQELSAKTVIELRKLAKANGVTLGAGVSKSDIVAKLAAALADDAQEAPAAPVPQAEPSAAGRLFCVKGLTDGQNHGNVYL